MTNLNERAVLCTLHLGIYSGKVTDAERTEEVRAKHKAQKGAGSYTKQIISPKFLGPVTRVANQAKATHELLTLPWEKGGTGILNIKGYETYTTKMRELRYGFDAAVRTFAEVYETEAIPEARERLTSMFAAEDYPTAAEVVKKFSFDVEIKHVPDAADFRVKLNDQSVALITQDIERRNKERLVQATDNMFERVQGVVEKMVDRLKEYSEGETTFRDSLVWNIKEVAEMLPTLNITDDPRINELSQKLLSELAANEPEILRSDAKVRNATAIAAERILKRVNSYIA